MGRHPLAQYTIVRSKVTARITTDPLISVQYLWSLIFLSLNCQNRSETTLKRLSYHRRWTLKKISSKFFNFLWSKNIFRKNIFSLSIFFDFQNPEKKSKNISIHFSIFRFLKISKKNTRFFFKIFFRPPKNKIFRFCLTRFSIVLSKNIFLKENIFLKV